MEHKFMKFHPELEPYKSVFQQRAAELLKRILLFTRVLWPFKSHSKVNSPLDKPIALIIPPINAYSFFCKGLKRHLEQTGHDALVCKPVGLFSSHTKAATQLEDYILSNNLRNCKVIGLGSGAFLPLLMSYKGRDRVSSLITVEAPFGGRGHFLVPFFPSLFELRSKTSLLSAVREQARTFANIHCIFFDEKDRLGRHDDIQFSESGVYQLPNSKALCECLDHLL